MRAWTLPLKNLARRPLRNVMAGFAVALAAGTYLAMASVFGGITKNWSANLDAGGIHALILQDQQIDWLASAVPVDLAASLSARPEVAQATPELLAFLSTDAGTPILVAGWPAGAADWAMLPGRTGVPPPGTVLAGVTLATTLQVGVGDTLEIEGMSLRVAGIIASDDPMTGGQLIMRLNELQAAMFREGTATMIRLRLTDPADHAATARLSDWLAETAPGLALRPTTTLARDNRVLNLLDVLSRAVVWTIALAGGAGVANAMLMTVNERRSEIGLYRALGWSPVRILALFLSEALAISFAGGLAGVAVGAAIVVSIRSNATLEAFLSTGITAPSALAALAFAVGIGGLGGAIPAALSLRTPMDAALRSV